jgi:hypothetical protein
MYVCQPDEFSRKKFTVVAVMEMYFVGITMGVSAGKITSGVWESRRESQDDGRATFPQHRWHRCLLSFFQAGGGFVCCISCLWQNIQNLYLYSSPVPSERVCPVYFWASGSIIWCPPFQAKAPIFLSLSKLTPQRPLFDDFAFSSPRSSDKTTHSHAAQVVCNTKHSDYSKHHHYPDDVFFPLAAERSGYLHPTFISFIDTFFAQASSAHPSPSDRLNVLYAIAHADTYIWLRRCFMLLLSL